jgi:hypothetical protein
VFSSSERAGFFLPTPIVSKGSPVDLANVVKSPGTFESDLFSSELSPPPVQYMPLYLSNPGALDRIDPIGSADVTKSRTAVLGLPQSGSIETVISDKATYIYESESEDNYGDSQDIRIRTERDQHKRGLVEFDLSSFSGQTVSSAVIHFHVNSNHNDIIALSMQNVMADWDEGSENGDDDEANWDYRKSGSLWAYPGGEYSGSLGVIDVSGNATGDFSTSLPIDVVQDWIDNPTTNYGIGLVTKATSGAELFITSDDDNIDPAPYLILNFGATSGIPDTTFTMIDPLCENLSLAGGSDYNIIVHVDTVGNLDLTPPVDITATLRYSSPNIVIDALTNPTFNISGSDTTLSWTGNLSSDLNLLSGGYLSLEISNNEANGGLIIVYDSNDKPSRIDLLII